MVGAVQIGVLAACVVLFVPMGMAGWHLSRNKMLFFSGALFITLAVGVHLTPYFPVVSDIVSSLTSVSAFPDNRRSCLSFLHHLIFNSSPPNSSLNSNSNSNSNSWSWSWSKSTPVVACRFQRLRHSDASILLNGSWVVVAGDSQARLFSLALLNLILDSAPEIDTVRSHLFKRHSDYHILIRDHAVKFDFVWSPYPSNLTALLEGFARDRAFPDVIVMGSALWHMLHFTNASDYGLVLASVKRTVDSVLSVFSDPDSNGGAVAGGGSVSPHMFWLGTPTLVNTMLNTEEKKEKMNLTMCEAYDRELYESKLLRQFAGSLLFLDVESLTRRCGIQCTMDGMHYDQVVYDAAIHIMLNALLIESQQQI